MPESFDPYLSWLGIRDPERPPNHYRLLGVAIFENDPEVLAHAADRQMSHVRTFQTGPRSAESQRLLNELATAKVCLLNPKKKADYDAALQAKQAAAAPPPLAVPPPLPVEGPPPETLPTPPLAAPPELSSDAGLASWGGSWIGTASGKKGDSSHLPERPATNVPSMPGSAQMETVPFFPPAAKPGSPLVSVAIVVLTLLAIVLGGLIVALRNPDFRAKLGLGGPPQEEPVATEDDVKTEEPESKTEEKTEPVVEPKTEPGAKTDVEPKPDPKPPVKPDVPKPPAWVDASKSGIRCGNVEVKIASAAIAWPQLVEGDAKVQATEPCLLVTVSLENAGAAAVDYAGWGPSGEAGQVIAVQDSLAKSYPPKTFAAATVEGQLGKTSLAAGGTATDVLPFEPPAADEQIAYLRLPLPAAALGQQGTLYFEIPAAMLTREPPPKPDAKTVVDRRLEVPGDDEVQKALERIRQLFPEDYRVATPELRKTAVDKLRKLYRTARETKNNPVERYALYSEVCDRAILLGDAAIFQEALATIGREYQVDTSLRAIEALQATLQPSPKRPRSNEAYKAAAVAGMQLARMAAARERHEAARELADLAWKIASKYGSDTKDYIPKKEAADLKKEVQLWQQRYDVFRAAEAVLAKTPDDPAANLTCGLYCISVRGDWTAALPMLSKGRDATLQKLAAADLAAPAEPAAMVAVADGWWELGGQKDDPLRRSLLTRAKFWYDKALPGLTGLDREAVNKRIKDAEAMGIK